MECFCGCGLKLRRGATDLNLQASRFALELLAWDKARADGRLGPPAADDGERLIERGAECFQRLLRALHGETEVYDRAEGERWIDHSIRERTPRRYMTERGSLFKRDKLLLSEDDIERLDRRHPERSISGAGVSAGSERAPARDLPGQLERLAELHAEGVLSDEEFAAAKARVATESRPR